MKTIPGRGRYQGVVQILKFNWRMYVAAAAGICVVVPAWPLLPPSARAAVLLGGGPALFWMAASLLVSHYVYDRFPIYDLHWLSRALTHAPRRWINLHSGWDETSGLLAAIFPNSIGEAVDLFDPSVMTEASIREAHRVNQKARVHGAIAATPARFDALPFENGVVDTAFAIFAIHELRRHDQRVRLLKEVARILVPGGELVLMEHARDGWNFLAFGPGFLHFFSCAAWRRAACQAGLTARAELAMTPFVHVFILRRTR